MSYLTNRKTSSSSLTTALPFQALESRTSGDDPLPAIRIVYGEVNPNLPGWGDYKTPQGMDKDTDSTNPYQFDITKFQEGLNIVALLINFSIASFQPISQHSLNVHPKDSVPEDEIKEDLVYFYLPIAEVSKSQDTLTVTLQYFTGNVLFRPYYTVVNGAATIEFFKCEGKSPIALPQSEPSE
jgi:hypothetical protein